MLLRLPHSLNALYTILFSVRGSSTLSSALHWKTPHQLSRFSVYSSVPSTSNPSLNFTVLRRSHYENAPWATTLSEAGIFTSCSPLPAKAPRRIASSPSGNSTLFRLVQLTKTPHPIAFRVDGR